MYKKSKKYLVYMDLDMQKSIKLRQTGLVVSDKGLMIDWNNIRIASKRSYKNKGKSQNQKVLRDRVFKDRVKVRLKARARVKIRI